MASTVDLDQASQPPIKLPAPGTFQSGCYILPRQSPPKARLGTPDHDASPPYLSPTSAPGRGGRPRHPPHSHPHPRRATRPIWTCRAHDARIIRHRHVSERTAFKAFPALISGLFSQPARQAEQTNCAARPRQRVGVCLASIFDCSALHSYRTPSKEREEGPSGDGWLGGLSKAVKRPPKAGRAVYLGA